MKLELKSGRLTLRQKRIVGAAAVALVLTLFLVVIGNIRISGYIKASMEESIRQSESEAVKREKLESIEESKAEETAVHEIKLTDAEEQLLNLLMDKFRKEDVEGAARVLNGNEDAFQSLFYGKLADEVCLYDGCVMHKQADGHGLVFERAGTVFYGDFKSGKPSGRCEALQAITLDEGVRYDYSCGTWEEGVMAGRGECGYDYYDGVSGDGAKKTVKKGDFSNDLMEGEITYTSINGKGESTSWTMTVDHGVIIPDDRWIADTADDGAQVFRLKADTDDVNAYVVEASDMNEARWKNMIVWGE